MKEQLVITVIKTHDLVQAEKKAGGGPKDGKSRAAWDGSRSEETSSGGGRTRRVAESRSEPEEDRQGKRWEEEGDGWRSEAATVMRTQREWENEETC